MNEIDVALQFGAFVARCAQLFFECGLFSAQFVHRGRLAASGRSDLVAQFLLGQFCSFRLLAKQIVLVFTLGENFALQGKAAFEIGSAAGQQFGFLDLHKKLPVEIADASAEILDASAGAYEFARRRVGFAPLFRKARLCVAEFLFRFVDATLQRINLTAHASEFGLMTFGFNRVIAQFAGEFAEFGLLVGERLFGGAQQLGLGCKFFFRGPLLIAQQFLARLQ